MAEQGVKLFSSGFCAVQYAVCRTDELAPSGAPVPAARMHEGRVAQIGRLPLSGLMSRDRVAGLEALDRPEERYLNLLTAKNKCKINLLFLQIFCFNIENVGKIIRIIFIVA